MSRGAGWDLRRRIRAAIVHHPDPDDATEMVLSIIDMGLITRCTDDDCVRLGRHQSVALHHWRHQPVPPLDRGLLGWVCLSCGRYSWRRIHKRGRGWPGE